jgi:hypothetical protein
MFYEYGGYTEFGIAAIGLNRFAVYVADAFVDSGS